MRINETVDNIISNRTTTKTTKTTIKYYQQRNNNKYILRYDIIYTGHQRNMINPLSSISYGLVVLLYNKAKQVEFVLELYQLITKKTDTDGSILE